MNDQTKPRGPKPDHLKVEGDWKTAINKALKKKRPKGGWPEKPDTTKPQPDPGDKSND